MPAVIRDHRLLILALVGLLAVAVLLVVVLTAPDHAHAAVHHARAAFDEARSSWGRHLAHLLRSHQA